MKIYTKTGDAGTTGLFGGQRVGKDAVRLDAYGTIDELNACLGVAASMIGDEEIKGVVQRLQNELFVIGGDLATPLGQTSSATLAVPRATAAMTQRLETEIDLYTEETGPLTQFILPGGCPSGALLHQARCICRRAERIIVRLSREETLNEFVLPYVNRLSDHLFTLARVVNYRAEKSEIPWVKS